jgi:hypothetical protein
MRRILFASTCIFALTAGARAQVAVIDPTGLVAQAKQLVETVKEETQGLRSYLTQLQQYSTELQTYATDAEMAANFIHSPSLGAAEPLLNLTGVNSAMPINPMSVMSMVNGFGGGVTSLSGSIGKLQQLTSLTNSIAGTNRVYQNSTGTWVSQQSIANANAIAGTQGSAMDILQQMQDHIPVLQALRDKLASSTNMKDVADAQGQISSELVWTQNATAQLQAIQVAALVQQDNRQQRADEMMHQSLDSFIDRVTNEVGPMVTSGGTP